MADRSVAQTRRPPRRWWLVLLVGAGWILWGFGYQTVWRRYSTDLDGIVTMSQDVPATGGPRYVTNYVVRGDDGQERRYVAGPTDGSLARSLPVGTQIRKHWGEFGYAVNGRWVAFPIGFYAGLLGLAGVLVVAAGTAWRRER